MLTKAKPTSPGRRHLSAVDKKELHKGSPEKSLLLSGHIKRQGRGHKGHVTMRHRGGGVKKRLRLIDWKRNKYGVPGIIKQIEYDPMRSANIALVYYKDGDKKYIIAPDGLKIGQEILSGESIDPVVGNSMALKNVPIGMQIHNVELTKGKGAQLARGAGQVAVVQSKEDKYVIVQLPSKEHRLINGDCFATIGQVGNHDWKNRKLGKAGTKRLMGIRPTVRGTAQHPDSHPHGGGEGRSGVGLKYSKTPWGKIASPGKKTRNKRKTNKWIVKDRRIK